MPRWHLLLCRYMAIVLLVLNIIAAIVDPAAFTNLLIALLIAPIIVWATYFIKPKG